jgi:hypothetical protein
MYVGGSLEKWIASEWIRGSVPIGKLMVWNGRGSRPLS